MACRILWLTIDRCAVIVGFLCVCMRTIPALGDIMHRYHYKWPDSEDTYDLFSLVLSYALLWSFLQAGICVLENGAHSDG